MSQGIQNNNIQKIDLVYTKLGRFLKSINSPDAEITKFALSDDGIDYGQYDINLPEDQRDLKIRRTAQFDAWTDQDSVMKNKLISLQRDTTEKTKLKVSPSAIEFTVNPSSSNQIEVGTVTIQAGYATPNGFNVRLSDSKYFSLFDSRTIDAVEFDDPLIMMQSEEIDNESQQDQEQQFMRRRRRFGRDRLPSVFFDGGNGNKEPQSGRVTGSPSIPTIRTFKVYYDESNRRKYDLNTVYKTKVAIESVDSGEVKEIELKLTPTTQS